jgi:hypothetical protein
MEDIDKIAELFISGQFQLSFQLCDSIRLDKVEMLIYVWDKYKEDSSIPGDVDLISNNNILIAWFNEGIYRISSGFYKDVYSSRFSKITDMFNELIKCLDERSR